MHPRMRRLLQRSASRLSAVQREALEVRPGDPIANELGAFGAGSSIEHPYLLMGNRSAVRIGSGTEIVGGLRLEALAPPGATIVTIGDRCLIHANVRLVAVNGIELHDDVAVGPNCSIIDTIHDYKSAGDVPSWQAPLRVGKRLVVERGVFIGSNCVVTGGITIGAGSIIGPNSSITRDVPPDVLVAGSPPRVVRRRSAGGEWVWVQDPTWGELEPKGPAAG